VEKKVKVELLHKLGFGKCKIMLAAPENLHFENLHDINNKTIATSYPNILQTFLDKNSLTAKTIEISGSVEIAPALGVADLICDIVSTGTTLMMNKLKKSFTVFESQAALICSNVLLKDEKKNEILNELMRRIRSVLTARSSKYLMMNVPIESLEQIEKLIPSIKSPTIVPLADPNMVAVHAVIPSDLLWKIVDQLKKEGASGILLLPIENMIL